jgi:hypothetical protein
MRFSGLKPLEGLWLRNLAAWRNFVKEGDISDRGYVTVTDRPGIGVEMDDEGARRAQVPGSRWFEWGRWKVAGCGKGLPSWWS